MKRSSIARAGAAALLLAITPTLAAAAPERDCGAHACGCPTKHENEARRSEAARERAREAQDAFLQQVWTAP